MRVQNSLSLIVTASVFLLLGFAARPAAAKSAAQLPVNSLTTAQPHPIQLADEINRRLSRMGISFSRTRLPHPYDDVGQVC